MLTNNSRRTASEVDAANPRPHNVHGHILELIPPQKDGVMDHAADEFRWEMFLRAGNPRSPEDQASYPRMVSQHGWLSCPDNCTFDREGRLWISTDGAAKAAGVADAIYACDTAGPGRGITKQFFRSPIGAEICGPCFTPDNSTIFAAIQHPGEGNRLDKSPSTFENPSTRWPDFDPDLPPRPAVVAITKRDGGPIGD